MQKIWQPRANLNVPEFMQEIPLLGHADQNSLFAIRSDQKISVADFLHDVDALAKQLPAKKYMLNLCADRYRFAVGFCAALLRNQISLLPPNYTPDFVQRLAVQYPDLFCLTERDAEFSSIEIVQYPEQITSLSGEINIPHIPSVQCAALVFTSGSTGEPMPHPKTWGSLCASAAVEAVQLGIKKRSGLALLGTVPAQHMYGLESTVMLALHNGLTLVAERPFYPSDIVTQLAALPMPRCLVTTPIHLRSLLQEAASLPALDFVLSATAQLSQSLAKETERRFDAPLYEIYGCTEAGQVASRRPVNSLAWAVLDGIKMRQSNMLTWVVGGHVEQEVSLNDEIELNADGRFMLHGRMADLVNIAGKRTSLASLNYHLTQIPGVRDGVFMLPDERDDGIARPIAFVVAPNISRDEIMAALRLCVDAVFLPRQLYFVESIPRNATGKLTKAALQNMLSQCIKS